MKTPQWAQDLIINAMIYTKSDKPLPEVKWRRPTQVKWNRQDNIMTRERRGCSSGTCYKTHITICAGKDRVDCKMVVLHELAHWIRPFGEHHSDAFWDLAWELYRWAKLPIKYCKKREQNYRVGSLAAYRRSKNK